MNYLSGRVKSYPGFPMDHAEMHLPYSPVKIKKILEEDRYVKVHRRKYDLLTRREKEIITLLMKGLTNPEIADYLFISRRTVEQHRKNINRKLAVSSFAELYKFGYAFDLI